MFWWNLASRKNPPGSISGRQLGEAAHRLVVNSLQVKADRNGYGEQMLAKPLYHAAAAHGPPNQHIRFHDEDHTAVPPGRDYPAQDHHRSSNSSSVRSHFDPGYGQQHRPPSSHRPHNRSLFPVERNNLPANNGDYHTQGYYPQGFHQNGPRYPPRPVAQPLIPAGAHLHHQTGYNSYQTYQSQGPPGYNQWRTNWAPQPGHNIPRGYSHPQHSGNQFSALERGTNRRPPPSGNGRR